MKIKSYFAGTVEAAVASARVELGSDAMLMRSKRTTADTRHLGEYEVVVVVRYGVSKKRPTQFLSMDTERIAAADQLHSFAAILGAGFQTVETSNALSVALEEHRNKELILIDTPGYGPRELQNTNGHVEMLSRHAEIDVHLVLSAAMKPAYLAGTIDG